MANLRINWDPPLLTDIVDSISIYRVAGATTDCSVIQSTGTLVAENLPVSQTTYDDLGTPDFSNVTYGVYSVNTAGLSLCAYATLNLPPTAANSPSGIASRIYDLLSASDGPTSLSASDYTITGIANAAPTSLLNSWELTPYFGVDMGKYVYPLYATNNEAKFHDDIVGGGSGTYSSITYLGNVYYMPANGGTTNGSTAPGAFTHNGFTFSYTQIQTGVEAERLDETEEGPSSLTATLQP